MLQGLKAILTNPQIFNWVILCLYLASGIRWAIVGNTGQSLYAAGAVLIIYSLTLMR